MITAGVGNDPQVAVGKVGAMDGRIVGYSDGFVEGTTVGLVGDIDGLVGAIETVGNIVVGV